MKHIFGILGIILLVGVIAFGVVNGSNSTNSEYLRIHITANSNQVVDQNVKYQIKDSVVEYLIPFLSECETKQDATVVIESKLTDIENVANAVLSKNNLNYKSKVYTYCEKIPTRSYDGFVVEEGFYDALVINLGEAQGDNWWCVVYPPLCFLNPKTSSNIKYKSKIAEIIKKIIGQ